MEEREIIEKLSEVGDKYKFDIIEEVAVGVYRLRNSNIPKTAKTGGPHLFAFDKYNNVYRLNDEERHLIVSTYNGFYKRLK